MLRHVALVLLLCGSSSGVHNNGTESLEALPDPPEPEPEDETLNQARNRGRGPAEAARNGPAQTQMGCRELRSTKYISDGQCTSVSPIKELVCAGECVAAHLLPNWIGGDALTRRRSSRREGAEWRCVIHQSRSQRIQLQCSDGSSRTYKINVVTSCKCKRYSRQQNDSGHKAAPLQSQRKSQDKGKVPPEN